MLLVVLNAWSAVAPIDVASTLPPGDVVVSTSRYADPIERGTGVPEFDGAVDVVPDVVREVVGGIDPTAEGVKVEVIEPVTVSEDDAPKEGVCDGESVPDSV